MNARFARVFSDHNVGCLAPSGNRYAAKDHDVHKLRKTLEESWMLNQGLVVAKVAARGRGGRTFFSAFEAMENIVVRDGRRNLVVRPDSRRDDKRCQKFSKVVVAITPIVWNGTRKKGLGLRRKTCKGESVVNESVTTWRGARCTKRVAAYCSK